jgi:hypothetical protein
MSETTQTAEPEVRRISACTGCQQAMPLRLTKAGEQPIAWACAACGAAFSAVLDETAEAALHRNVRVSEKLFAACRSQVIPQGMINFMNDLGARDIDDNRRQQKRFAVALRAIAIPVDQHVSPVDEAFTAMTLNISQSGLALIHTRAVNHRYLLIELDDPQQTQVVLEVIRSRHVGRFYDIAGRFVTRLGVVQKKE